MKFQIKTRDPAIAPHRQAAATLEALPYTSTSKSYIHLGNINPAALVCSPFAQREEGKHFLLFPV